jgi:hypothetical protein
VERRRCDHVPTKPHIPHDTQNRRSSTIWRFVVILFQGSVANQTHNADIYSEHGPPTDVADKIVASFPLFFQSLVHQRVTKRIEEADKFVRRYYVRHPRRLICVFDREILDGLKRVGFKLSTGIDGTGFLLLAWTRAGGYYLGSLRLLFLFHTDFICPELDVGASQMIIDGKIKLKSDSQIKEFIPNGIKFEDGSEIAADVVVFATG